MADECRTGTPTYSGRVFKNLQMNIFYIPETLTMIIQGCLTKQLTHITWHNFVNFNAFLIIFQI